MLPRLTLPPGGAGDGAGGGEHENGAYPWDGFDPARPAGRRVTIVAETDTQTDEMMMGCFSTHQNDPDWHMHRLISLIFGGDMNSRLFRVVRGERGLSYGANCWYDATSGRVPRNLPAPFSFYSFPSVEHSAEAAPLLVRLYEELVAEGVSEEELERAKASLIHSNPFRFDTPEKQLAREVQHALYGVPLEDEGETRAVLEGIGRADIHRALARHHRPRELEIVLLGDPARLEPVARSIEGVEKVETIRYP